MNNALPRRVLMTGAAGELGTILSRELINNSSYELLLLDRCLPVKPLSTRFVHADVADFAAIRPHLAGVDTVIHLAAEIGNAPWESFCTNNITGVYNVLQAASEARCRRVVFASSSHVVLGDWTGSPLDSHAPIRPNSLYGASKACGEALASYFAYERGLSVICLRIGWVTPYDHPRLTPGSFALDLVIMPGDFVRLIVVSIEAPTDLRFGVTTYPF